MTDVAARLGVSTPSLYKWVKEYSPDPEVKEKVELIELRREVLRLRSELTRTQEDREILKKPLRSLRETRHKVCLQRV